MIYATAGQRFGEGGDDTVALRAWNVRVGLKDTVWHLGDFGTHVGMADVLNGNKFILKGANDRAPWQKYHDAGFQRLLELSDRDEKRGLAFKIWNDSVVFLTYESPSSLDLPFARMCAGFRQWIWLCAKPPRLLHDRVISVGVESCDYLPMSLESLFNRARANWHGTF